MRSPDKHRFQVIFTICGRSKKDFSFAIMDAASKFWPSESFSYQCQNGIANRICRHWIKGIDYPISERDIDAFFDDYLFNPKILKNEKTKV